MLVLSHPDYARNPHAAAAWRECSGSSSTAHPVAAAAARGRLVVARAGRLGPAPGGRRVGGLRTGGGAASVRLTGAPEPAPRRGVDDGLPGAAAFHGRSGDRPWHVAVVVENVAVGVDTRLRKQVDDLLRAGYRLSVVTRRHPDNDRYRDVAGMTLLEYPEPAEPGGAAGYLREYAVSFAWASWHLLRLRLRGRIDVLQVCQPPDIYFPLAVLARWGGARVVVDQRDLMPELLASRYERPPRLMTRVLFWLERRTQRSADHTLTVNDWLRQRLVASAPRRPGHARAQRSRAGPGRAGPGRRRAPRTAPAPGLLGGEDGPPGPGRPRPPRRRPRRARGGTA